MVMSLSRGAQLRPKGSHRYCHCECAGAVVLVVVIVVLLLVHVCVLYLCPLVPLFLPVLFRSLLAESVLLATVATSPKTLMICPARRVYSTVMFTLSDDYPYACKCALA